MTMKCPSANPWTEIKPGYWLRTDSDGYILRVRRKASAWRWSVQPPGGGYDVVFGTKHEADDAKESADESLQGLHAELKATWNARRGIK
jgi:hypothetical protein